MENLVEQTRLAIYTLYHSGESSSKKAAELWLLSFLKDPNAWDFGVSVARIQNVELQFFGLKCLEHHAKHMSHTWENSEISDKRNVILELLSFFRSSVVLRTKCASVLVQLILQLSPEKWNDPLTDITQYIIGRNGFHDPPEFRYFEHFNECSMLIEVFDLLAEEIQNVEMNATKSNFLLHELKGNNWKLLVFPVLNHGLSNELAEVSLRCLTHWIELGLDARQIQSLLPLVITHLTMPGKTLSLAADVMIELFESSSIRASETVLAELFSMILTKTAQLANVYQYEKINETDEDGEEMEIWIKLYTCIGEQRCMWISSHIELSCVQSFLQFLMRLSSSRAYCTKTLHFWYLLHEEILLFASDCPRTEYFDGLYEHLFYTLLRHLEYTANGSSTLCESFSVLRRDIGDTIVYIYYILKEKLVRCLHDRLLTTSDAVKLEALLFCVSSLSSGIVLEDVKMIHLSSGDVDDEARDVLKISLNVSIQKLLDTCLYMSTPTYPNVLLMWMQLIGDYASCFPSTVDACERLLRSFLAICTVQGVHWGSISMQDLISTMLVSWDALCAEGKSNLFPMVSFAMNTIYPLLTSNENKLSFIKSVSYLFSDDTDTIRTAFVSFIQTAIVALERSTVHGEIQFALQFLLAATENVNMGERLYSDWLLSWWSSGWASTKSREILGDCDLAQRWLSLLQRLLKSVALKEFSLVVDGSLATYMMQMTVMSPIYLDLVLMFINVDVHRASLLLNHSFICVWRLLTTKSPFPGSQEQQSQHQIGHFDKSWLAENDDVVISFIQFLTEILKHHGTLFYSLKEEMMTATMQLIKYTMLMNEREIARSGYQLFSAFIHAKSSPQNEQTFQQLLNQHGNSVLRVVLDALGERQPRSMIPDISEVLWRWQSDQFDSFRALLPLVLQQEGFPTRHVSVKDKALFVKSCLQTRNAKLFKENIKSFALKCRHLENTAFGNT